jgi:glycosyltransferase involved in cell wall biosynthesis
MPTVKVIFFANSDWYLYNFRRSLALAAQSFGYEMLLISPPGEYGARLRSLGLDWRPLSRMDRRSLNLVTELQVLLGLVALFRREHPALVHGFTIKCAVYGSLAAQLARVPARVNAVAGLGYVFASNDRKARWLRPMVRVMLRLALRGRRTRLILQNPDDQEMFEQSGLIELDRIDLIPGSGVDCTRFTPRAEGNPARRSQPCVLLAARLLWDKGVAEYVEASRLLRSAGRTIRFLLAGMPDPGNPAAVPESTLRQWVDEGAIEWLGHVDDTSELFRSVDILALPTYYGEGLPKSLIEAAACALPLVTTDMPGCREVVTDEVDGLLIPPRDPGALAHAIARLIDSPELAARLGAAARAKAVAHFDERIVIERTLAVYGKLLRAS